MVENYRILFYIFCAIIAILLLVAIAVFIIELNKRVKKAEAALPDFSDFTKSKVMKEVDTYIPVNESTPRQDVIGTELYTPAPLATPTQSPTQAPIAKKLPEYDEAIENSSNNKRLPDIE